MKTREHLLFNFLEFRFFRNSERGNAIVFGNPRPLMFLVAIPYILIAEVMFFRSKRFFVKVDAQIAGVFVVRQRQDKLVISSLAVAPECRRLGLATFMLDYASGVAARLGEKSLELSVLKRNISAQRLYVKFGFAVEKERRWSFTLQKKLKRQ